MTKLADLKSKWMKDQEFEREYNALSDEFSIASALIQARVQAKMTQEQVAIKMKSSQSYIAKLEGGIVNPSMKALQRYAEATGSHLKISFEP